MPNREKMDEIKYDIQNGERIEREGKERAMKDRTRVPAIAEMSRSEMEHRFIDAAHCAKEMSSLVNRLGAQDADAFIEFMLREHRTLQQSFTGLCLKFLYELAKDRYGHDARNSASVEAARKVRDCLGDYGYSLPLI